MSNEVNLANEADVWNFHTGHILRPTAEDLGLPPDPPGFPPGPPMVVEAVDAQGGTITLSCSAATVANAMPDYLYAAEPYAWWLPASRSEKAIKRRARMARKRRRGYA